MTLILAQCLQITYVGFPMCEGLETGKGASAWLRQMCGTELTNHAINHQIMCIQLKNIVDCKALLFEVECYSLAWSY